MVVGSNLSRAITGNAPFIGTLIATGFIIAIHWIVAHLASRYPSWSFIAEGRPVALVMEGKPCLQAMRRFGVSRNDIEEALSQKDIDQLEKVYEMTLEPSGRINVRASPAR